jgi:hypothetical protein
MAGLVGRRGAGDFLADLYPGYFALVMATGIIAVGAVQQDIRWLAWALLWLNVGSTSHCGCCTWHGWSASVRGSSTT